MNDSALKVVVMDPLVIEEKSHLPLIEITKQQKTPHNHKSLFQRVGHYASKYWSTKRNQLKQITTIKLVQRYLYQSIPLIHTIQHYPVDWRNKVWGDVIAGISIAMILIPQSLSYAAIANLPAVYGLYSSIIPMFMYAIFGSCQQLSVGPVAIVSILVGQELSTLSPN
jgi:hypothetical protein